MPKPVTIDVSVLLEFENARFTADSFTAMVLDAIAREVSSARSRELRIELLVLYDNTLTPEADVSAVLDRLRASGLGEEVRAIGHPTALYYELKNVGVRAARGEIVVGIDSDVRPEPGWLAVLLDAQRRYPEQPFLLGHTYFRVTDPFSRAYALSAHYFPLRHEGGGGVCRWKGLWVNNFISTKSFLLEEPFGTTPCDVARGGCLDFDRRLRTRGIFPHVVHDAKAEHYLAETAELRRQEGVKLGATSFFVRRNFEQGFRASYLASLCQAAGVLVVRVLLAAPARARALGVSPLERPKLLLRVAPIVAIALLTEARLRLSSRARHAYGFE